MINLELPRDVRKPMYKAFVYSKYRKDNNLLSLDSFLEPDGTTEVLEVDKKIKP